MKKMRNATLADIPKLVQLENSSFDGEQLSADNFKYALKKAHASLRVYEEKKEIAGYFLLFFHKGTSLARVYSVAVSPKYRGQGIGKKLLDDIDEVAIDRDCTYVRLEVKESNKGAIHLYEENGYRIFNHKMDYYEDHQNAICYEKKIRTPEIKAKNKVYYYEQSTDFTCGPSSLMMVLKTFNPKMKLTRELELDLWREATTIFMSTGHGGCGPHGLALAAYERGLKVELYINQQAPLFIDSVRDPKKKEVIELVQNNFESKLKKRKVKIHYNKTFLKTLKKIIDNGGVALVLISAYRLTASKVPHWIVVTNIEGDFIYFNDPDLKTDQDKLDNINIPVRIDEFEKMSKYGSKQLKCIIALYK